MKKFYLFSMFIVFALLTHGQVPSYVPTDGLIGYWPFNGNANDESGNGNDGLISGSTFGNDRFGMTNSSASFSNSSSQFISTNIGIQDTLTMSVWYSCGTQTKYYPTLIDYGNSVNANLPVTRYLVHLAGEEPSWINSFTGRAYIQTNVGGEGLVSDTQITTDTEWHNLVCVFVPNDAAYLYIDGELIGQDAAPNSQVYSGSLFFGRDANDNAGACSGCGRYEGLLDDVAIWNRVLTSQEIQNIYLSSLPTTQCLPDYVPTNGLVGYWPFCGNANDESGNGNDGVVFGATSTSDRFGNNNSAYSFDGISNRIDVQHSPGLSIFGGQSSSTISLWCYGSFNTSGEFVAKGFHSVNVAEYGNRYLATSFVSGNNESLYNVLYNATTINSASCPNNLFTSNQWHHVVFIRGSEMKIFVDGIEVTSTSNNNGWNVDYNLVLDNTSMTFGARSVKDDNNVTFHNFFFSGKLDDIGIWNRALTAQEIQNLYNGNLCSVTANITAQGSTTICSGQTVTLDANTGVGYTYQWYLNGNAIAGASSSTYSASAAGAYTVYIADGSGCSATSNPVSVSVNALPSVSIVGNGTLTLCAGQSIAITANVTGGSNYQWNLNGNPISGATSLTLTIASAGAYTLTVTNSSNCSVLSGTLNVSIANLTQPQITASGPTTFCQGGNVVLSTAQDATYSYQWKKDGINITEATSSSYTATQSGSYTVTVTNQAGCTATSSTQTITVNPNPTNLVINYQGASSVCQGQSVVLTSSVTGANQYQWYLAGNAVAGANANSYTAFQGGTYTLSASNQFGCTVTSNGLMVTIIPNPQPVITPSVNNLAQGQTATFTVTDVNGANQFSWQTNGSNLGWMNLPTNSTYSGGSSNTIQVTSVGLNNHLQPFRVTGFNGNCIGTSQEAIISILDTCITQVTVYDTIHVSVTDTLIIEVPTGLYEPNAFGEWLVYPNPTSDELTINFGDISLFNGFTIQIMNTMGQIVFLSNVVNQFAVVDVSTWSSGTYLISVLNETGTEVETKTLIIQ